jgi:hypothetical protein
LLSLVNQPGTLIASFVFGLSDNLFARLGCFTKNLSLLFASFLLYSLTFLLQIGQFQIGIVCFLKAIINVSLPIVSHLYDSREAPLPQDAKHDKEHE